MKSSIKRLKSKEREEIINTLKEIYGINPEFFKNKTFLYSDKKKEKLWLCSGNIVDFDLNGLKVDAIGMLFLRNTRFPKLTTNAVQLLRKEITKNIIEVNEEEAYNLIRGIDVKKEINPEHTTFVLKHKNDYLGMGMYKDGKIKSLIPKARRIKKL